MPFRDYFFPCDYDVTHDHLNNHKQSGLHSLSREFTFGKNELPNDTRTYTKVFIALKRTSILQINI